MSPPVGCKNGNDRVAITLEQQMMYYARDLLIEAGFYVRNEYIYGKIHVPHCSKVQQPFVPNSKCLPHTTASDLSTPHGGDDYKLEDESFHPFGEELIPMAAEQAHLSYEREDQTQAFPTDATDHETEDSRSFKSVNQVIYYCQHKYKLNLLDELEHLKKKSHAQQSNHGPAVRSVAANFSTSFTNILASLGATIGSYALDSTIDALHLVNIYTPGAFPMIKFPHFAALWQFLGGIGTRDSWHKNRTQIE